MEQIPCGGSVCLHCGNVVMSRHILRLHRNGATRRSMVACPEALYKFLDFSPEFSGRQFHTCSQCLRRLSSIRKMKNDTNSVEYRKVAAMLLQALSFLTKARNHAIISTTSLEQLMKESRNDIIRRIASKWTKAKISINRYDSNSNIANGPAQKLISEKKKHRSVNETRKKAREQNIRFSGLQPEMLEESDVQDLSSKKLRNGLSQISRSILRQDSSPKRCESKVSKDNSARANRRGIKRRAEVEVWDETLESSVYATNKRVELRSSQINMVPTVKNAEQRPKNLSFKPDSNSAGFFQSPANTLNNLNPKPRLESKSAFIALRMVDLCSLKIPTSKRPIILEDDISLDPDITPSKVPLVCDDHQHKSTQGSSSELELTSQPKIPSESPPLDSVSSGPVPGDVEPVDQAEASTKNLNLEDASFSIQERAPDELVAGGEIKVVIDGLPFTISECSEEGLFTNDLGLRNTPDNEIQHGVPPASCYSFTLVENPVVPSNSTENHGCNLWTIIENSGRDSQLNADTATQPDSANGHPQFTDIFKGSSSLASWTGAEFHSDSRRQNQLETPDHRDSTPKYPASVVDLKSALDLQPTNVIESAGDLEAGPQLETTFTVCNMLPEDTAELSVILSGSNETPGNQSFLPRSECSTSRAIAIERILEKCPVENCTFYYCPVTEPHRLPAHHKRIHKGIKYCYNCSYCPKVFQNYIGLQTHENWHMGVYPFDCSECTKKFLNKRQLKLHVTKYHCSEKLPLICTFCGKKFVKMDTFRLHVRSHTDGRLILCELCGLTFKGPSEFSFHRAGCKGDVSATQYPFAKCDQALSSQTRLMRHQVKDHGLHSLDPNIQIFPYPNI